MTILVMTVITVIFDRGEKLAIYFMIYLNALYYILYLLNNFYFSNLKFFKQSKKKRKELLDELLDNKPLFLFAAFLVFVNLILFALLFLFLDIYSLL